MAAKQTFTDFWKELRRLRLVVPATADVDDNRYRCAADFRLATPGAAKSDASKDAPKEPSPFDKKAKSKTKAITVVRCAICFKGPGSHSRLIVV